MKRPALCLTVAGLSLGGWVGAAPANVPSEAERAAMAIEKTLQRHVGEVHRCFERALADRLDVSGKVEIEVDVGENGKVTGARTLSEDKDAKPLSSCLLASAGGWQVDGIEVGASLVLPFDFAGQANQFVVKSGDVPERGPGAAKLKESKDGKPVPPPPFTTKVLADPVNVRSQNVSLTLLTVSPANRVAMHRHPHTAEALYLLKGHARLLGPTGTDPTKLDEGTAVFIPAGYPHVIENMGRQNSAVFLEVFAPSGPEKVYRDPKDAQGRAEFEVIRDPAKAKAPPAANGNLVVKSLSDVKGLPAFGGKATAHILLEPQDTGSPALALDVIEFSPGFEAPRHQHAGSEEVLYFTAGGGTLMVGSESYPFAAEDAAHIPADQPHSAKFGRDDKTIAIQIYAPAGPEQRFRGTTPPQPGKK